MLKHPASFWFPAQALWCLLREVLLTCQSCWIQSDLSRSTLAVRGCRTPCHVYISPLVAVGTSWWIWWSRSASTSKTSVCWWTWVVFACIGCGVQRVCLSVLALDCVWVSPGVCEPDEGGGDPGGHEGQGQDRLRQRRADLRLAQRVGHTRTVAFTMLTQYDIALLCNNAKWLVLVKYCDSVHTRHRLCLLSGPVPNWLWKGNWPMKPDHYTAVSDDLIYHNPSMQPFIFLNRASEGFHVLHKKRTDPMYLPGVRALYRPPYWCKNTLLSPSVTSCLSWRSVCRTLTDWDHSSSNR